MNPVVLYTGWHLSPVPPGSRIIYHRVSRQWVHNTAARKHLAKAELGTGKNQPIQTPFHLLQWGELKHMLFRLEKVPCLEDIIKPGSGGTYL